jgi:preprotein translocase subunit SecE
MKNPLFLFSYFAEVRDELKKVTWPSRTQTIQLTSIVIGVSLVVGLYISALDIIFSQIIQLF